MNRFLEKSEQQLFRGCICAIDGFLQTFSKPSKMDCDDFPQAYWSGHYMSYRLNFQAVCNSNCCFLYFGVVAPGKCPDQKAFERTKLFQIVSNLRFFSDTSLVLLMTFCCTPSCLEDQERVLNRFLMSVIVIIFVLFLYPAISK
jgi:hypothetical protein